MNGSWQTTIKDNNENICISFLLDFEHVGDCVINCQEAFPKVAISAQAVHHLRPTSLSVVVGCCAAAQAKEDAKEDEDLRKKIEAGWDMSVPKIEDWMCDPDLLHKQMEGIEIYQTGCAKC